MEQPNQVLALTSKRISFLKTAKSLANKYVEENIKAKQHHQIDWTNKVLENNIKQLKQIRNQINKDLHPKSVNGYVQSQITFKERYNLKEVPSFIDEIEDFGLFFEISKCSYSYSIINDMYWITDGTVRDHFDVITGQKPVEIFGEFCQDVIRKLLKEALPVVKREPYCQAAMLLEEICKKFRSTSYISSNILLHSLIESLVRTLAIFLYQKQNPHLNEEDAVKFVAGHMSMEKLITSSKWKNDIEISFIDAVLRSRYIQHLTLAQAEQIQQKQAEIKGEILKISEEISNICVSECRDDEAKRLKLLPLVEKTKSLTDEMIDWKEFKIHIPLTVELEFLLRRYKENRNAIVHGHFTNFDKKWYCYINLSAVLKVIRLIQTYEKLYGNSQHTPAEAS